MWQLLIKKIGKTNFFFKKNDAKNQKINIVTINSTISTMFYSFYFYMVNLEKG